MRNLANRIARLEAARGPADPADPDPFGPRPIFTGRDWVAALERLVADGLAADEPDLPGVLDDLRRAVREAEGEWDPPADWRPVSPHCAPAYLARAESQRGEDWRYVRFPAYRAALERLDEVLGRGGVS